MIDKPRVDSSKMPRTTYSNSCVKWCSVSSPRPPVGIDGCLYIDKERNLLSIWSDTYGCYVEFFGNKSKKLDTTDATNNTLMVKANDLNSNVYSFNVDDDNKLIITCPNGVIEEIPLPSTKTIEDELLALKLRVEKLEELLN